MADDSGGEKTLPASGQKKQRARQDGNVAKSQDLSSAAGLAAALLAMLVFGPGALRALITAGQYFFVHAYDLVADDVPLRSITMHALYYVAIAVVPTMIILVIAGLAMNLAQVGFLLTSKPLQPKFERLNFITGMKKFVSVRTFAESVKAIAKLGMVGIIVYFSMRSRIPELLLLMGMAPDSLLPAVASFVISVWWRIALAMLILGLFDYAYQYWQRERDLRMTQQEAKQELKELEGDPHIKRRVRQLQRQMAAQRMIADVPEADVIITNPTHYAVALRYDLGAMQTPVLLAKGARLVAQKIREIGVENDVPILQRPELTRTIYRTMEVGDPIPEELFQAVAEVLAYVYEIDRRAEKRREREALVASGEQLAASLAR